jgi:PAS domain-containing protein
MRVSVNPRFDGQNRFQGYVGMSFDVTETREAIEAMARQAQRQRFLLSLSDTLRELTDTDDVMAEANRALGERLGVNRVGFGELDNEAGVWRLARDWTAGVASNQGELPVGDFGDAVRIRTVGWRSGRGRRRRKPIRAPPRPVRPHRPSRPWPSPPSP